MRLITPPTLEAMTLTEVKKQIGIKSTDTLQDDLIIRRIAQAREWAEDYTQRSLALCTREIRINDFPRGIDRYKNKIALAFPDLKSVDSVKYIDIDGIEQTVSAADYVADTYELIPFISPVYGLAWPYARAENNAVRVQYKSGYDSVGISAAKTVTAATNASPGVFTSAGHGFIDGDIVKMVAAGMTEVNGKTYRIINKATDTFQLADLTNTFGISTSSYGVFTSGTVQKSKLEIPSSLVEAMMLLVGFWMKNQPQSENGVVISRVPYAIRDMLDKYSVVGYV